MSFWQWCFWYMKMSKHDNHSRRSRVQHLKQLQSTLGLNSVNFGTKTFKSLMGILCTSNCTKSCKCKMKLPSHKGLKSTIDLSSRRFSSNPIYSSIDINISNRTTHTPVLKQSLQGFVHCIKVVDISAIFSDSPRSTMKIRTVKLRKGKQKK